MAEPAGQGGGLFRHIKGLMGGIAAFLLAQGAVVAVAHGVERAVIHPEEAVIAAADDVLDLRQVDLRILRAEVRGINAQDAAGVVEVTLAKLTVLVVAPDADVSGGVAGIGKAAAQGQEEITPVGQIVPRGQCGRNCQAKNDRQSHKTNCSHHTDSFLWGEPLILNIARSISAAIKISAAIITA